MGKIFRRQKFLPATKILPAEFAAVTLPVLRPTLNASRCLKLNAWV